jgi:hypothetical protein
MPLSLSQSATEHIEKVRKWFIDAEVVKEETVLNMYKCTDEGRYTIVTPLLKELGLEVNKSKISFWRGNATHGFQKYAFGLLRISGPVFIRKEAGYDTLFYPLTRIEVNGEVLELGNYMRFNKTQHLNANLDFLAVHVPEDKI